MWEDLKENLEKSFLFKLNKNQWQDIQRLIFEITVRDSLGKEGIESIIEDIKKEGSVYKLGGRNKFYAIKNYLLKLRFPEISKWEKIDTKKVYLPKIRPPLKDNFHPPLKFYPHKVFVEKEVKDSYLAKKFKEKFPTVDVEEIEHYSLYLKKYNFTIKEFKKPIVFIVKEKWDFVRLCPCTKYHVRCGYWIFNLGFGCPFDCSYCFLQQYANFPGLILPSNLEDFFKSFEEFHRKINKKIVRIGTGEFCDSLALDDITDYSEQLIDFFRGKSVLFEFKTKSNKIDNILSCPPSNNIVVSWSLNPQNIIEKEELNTSSLEERIEAMQRVQLHGFPVGVHFDPIIYYPGWDRDYFDLLDKLYKKIKVPLKWISLGTLRCARELKVIAEQRFPQSRIFFGELLIGDDKKLRYHKKVREEIYTKMIKRIREYDRLSPIYLCMESKDLWVSLKLPIYNIEEYIIGEKI